MVRKLVAGLTRMPTVLVLGVALLALTLFVVLGRARVEGSVPYDTPFWTLTTPSPECPGCSGCGCMAPSEWSPERVSNRTGEFEYTQSLFSTPGLLEDLNVGFTWRSMVDGKTQMGASVIPSWEITVKKEILNSGNPNAANGNKGVVRRADGTISEYMWNGSAYVASSCNDTDTLTTASGNFVLTDKHGNVWCFDSAGMPVSLTDRNGNDPAFSYNSALQITGITDTRGKTYSFARNTNGYLTSITDPFSHTWSFSYDTNDNLTTVTSPATADQSSGIVTTLNYDSANRLTSVTDGRGNTAFSVAYVGTTRQVSSVTIDGNAVSYSYGTGYTTRTDRNGNVHKVYYSGTEITQTEMIVGSTAKYTTAYTWSGGRVAHVVFPRGNRIDYTWDSMGNLTGQRQRTTDTSTNDSSDIVESWAYNSANFMTSYTDPLGNVTSYSRDTHGNLTGITFPTVTNPASQTASVSISYNSHGQQASVTDEEGTVTDYSYLTSGTAVGLLDTVTVDSAGLDLVTQFGYDSACNENSRTDPRGKVYATTWDSLRRITETQAPSPLSYKIDYHYDENGNLVSKAVENRDKDGNLDSANPWITTTYTYTVTNDLATIVEEIDASHTRTTSFDVDANQNRIRVTLPEGNKIKTTYDERDLVASVITGETSAVASTVTRAYDDNGNLVTVTDALSNSTTFAWDLFDRQTKETNALSNYQMQDYDKAGNVTAIYRKNSSNTTLQRRYQSFDERNRLYQTSDLFSDPGASHSDAVTTIDHYKTGEVRTVTNARGKVTTYARDAAHRLTKVTDAMSNEFAYTLDANGNVTASSIKEWDGSTAYTHNFEATFDALNRKTEIVEVDRTNSSNRLSTTLGYDSRGERVWMVNAMGDPTRWTYDAAGRMTKIEKALTVGSPITTFTTAEVTEYGFDKNNRLVSHKDDASNESTWAYDARDLQTTMTYPDTNHIDYVRDANGNVTQVTDAAGNVIVDTFDALNRNTSRSVTLVSGFADTTAETRSFDALDRVTSNADDDSKVEYTYGVLGFDSFAYTETQTWMPGSSSAKIVTTSVDAVGNVTSQTYPGGASLTLTRTYNDIDRLATVTDGTNTIASFDYVGLRHKKTTFQSGATRNDSYTGFREEIASVEHKTSGGATLLRMDYGYNLVHDRTYERFGASGSAGDGFEYDKLRRLTTAYMGSVTPSAPSSAQYVSKIVYNMDDDGNRTSVVTTPYGQSAQTTSYTTNTLNQYTAVGSASPTYDSNGNLTNNGTYKFEYNYKNLITKVSNASTNAQIALYRYDPLGRRVRKAVTGGITQRYVYSGVETIATCDGSNNWKQNFVFAQGIDEVLMLEQADVLDYDGDSNTTEVVRSFYHRNALGSVMEITDASQAEAASYRYTPYGEMTITRGGTTQTSDPLGQHWGFTSRFFDEESSFAYYRFRAYAPSQGRFGQRDPLGVQGCSVVYAYVEGRPTALRDPLGLFAGEDAAIVYCRDLRNKLKKAKDDLDGASAAQDAAQLAYDKADATYDKTLTDDAANIVKMQSARAQMDANGVTKAELRAYDDIIDTQTSLFHTDQSMQFSARESAYLSLEKAKSQKAAALANLKALSTEWDKFCGPLSEMLSDKWRQCALQILQRNRAEGLRRRREGDPGLEAPEPPPLVLPPPPKDALNLPELPRAR